MPISDDDVKTQINHMMAFIEQEASEKAEEIDAKAEEEFNIEKGRLVQQQRVKIMEFYERKEKQVELQKKIQNSNLLNQARLKILKAREDHMRVLLEDAISQLTTVSKDKGRYKIMLQGLLVQGLFQLIEENVTVQCRQQDIGLIKEVLGSAAEAYKQQVQRDVKIVIDEDNCLPPECAGGVVLSAQRNKIRVLNTLESRLHQMSQQMLPELRTILYGDNPNRKFFD